MWSAWLGQRIFSKYFAGFVHFPISENGAVTSHLLRQDDAQHCAMLRSSLKAPAPRPQGWTRRFCAATPKSEESKSESPPVDDVLPPSSPSRTSPLLADAKRKRVIDRMLRVDHAGELGARRIYAGQLAVFGGTPVGDVIHEMAEQELKHLNAFDRLMQERRVRPTAMLPVWNAAGYALGLGTALMGKEAAMACTVAVEEVIAEHYNEQVKTLLGEEYKDEDELRETFREFRDDELEHKDTGIRHDAESAPFYNALSAVIKAGCKIAIATSERV